MNVDIHGAPIYFEIPILGGIKITASLVVTWGVMLVLTLKTCVPAVDAALTRLSGAARQTKTVQAFAALTERLREGEPVQEALSGSFEILTGAGN